MPPHASPLNSGSAVRLSLSTTLFRTVPEVSTRTWFSTIASVASDGRPDWVRSRSTIFRSRGSIRSSATLSYFFGVESAIADAHQRAYDRGGKDDHLGIDDAASPPASGRSAAASRGQDRPPCGVRSYPGEGCGASGSGSTAAGGDTPRSSLRRMLLVASTVARSKPDHRLRAPSSSGAAEPRERRPGIRSEMLHRTLAAGSPACRPLSAAGRLSGRAGLRDQAESSGLGVASRRDRARRWRVAGSRSSSRLARRRCSAHRDRQLLPAAYDRARAGNALAFSGRCLLRQT